MGRQVARLSQGETGPGETRVESNARARPLSQTGQGRKVEKEWGNRGGYGGKGSGGEVRAPQEEDGSEDEAVNGEEDKAMVPDPLQEPLHHAQRDEEGDHETDRKHQPAVEVHGDGRDGFVPGDNRAESRGVVMAAEEVE